MEEWVPQRHGGRGARECGLISVFSVSPWLSNKVEEWVPQRHRVHGDGQYGFISVLSVSLWLTYGIAGSTVARTSPKPMRTPFFSAWPRITTASPSSMNLRSEPSFSFTGLVPFQASSSMLP